jgi:hypothetical protein
MSSVVPTILVPSKHSKRIIELIHFPWHLEISDVSKEPSIKTNSLMINYRAESMTFIK